MCKLALANALLSALSFMLSALTSIMFGYLGMKITTYSNARTTWEAKIRIGMAFVTTFRYGFVMGFFLATKWILCSTYPLTFSSSIMEMIGRAFVNPLLVMVLVGLQWIFS